MLGASFSHYRITGKLGEGGMGVVYLAEDTLLGRKVAIKFPHPSCNEELRGRLLREARIASTLSHPYIASIHDCGEHEGHPYVVMEFVRGQSLDELLREGPLPPARALEIGVQAAEALAEAHRCGVVHRDIKPSNVRINQSGDVKVVDFGLARQTLDSTDGASSVSASPTVTLERRLAGTPPYMSPEQAHGEPGDSRSDLFSLGAVLYECLTGRRAFPGETTLDALAQVLEVDPPPPSRVNQEVPARLDRILAKSLAKLPEDRYQSADDMLADLRGADKPAIPVRPDRLKVKIAIVLLAAVVVIALAWSLRARRLHEPPAEALRWYQEGVNGLRDGTYYKAAQALQRATAADAKFALAYARLAEAWNELDYSDRAREAMLHAAALGGPAPRLSERDVLQLQAIHAVLTNDHAGAVARYRDLARSVSKADTASLLVDLGRALERADNSREALERYTEATRRQPDLAAAYLRLGVLLRRQRRYPEAEKAFDKAESLYRALSNLEGVTEALYHRSVLLNQTGRLSEARALLEQALTLAQTGGNTYQRIVVLGQLSSVEYMQGQAADGQRHAAEALELARGNGFEDLTARALMEVGGNAHVRGELKEAENVYLQALESARHFKGRRSEMRALVSLASVRMSLGKTGEAVRDLEAPLGWYDRNGYRKDAGTVRILLARAKRFGGDYDGAAAALEQQASEARHAGDEDLLILALGELGSTLLEQERYPEALGKFRQAYDLSAARGNKLRLRWEAAHLADTLWRLGRFPEARKSLEEAAQFATAGQDKALLAWVARLRAEMALSEGRFAEAAAVAKSSEAAEEDKTEAADAMRIAALAELGAGRKGQAKRLMERATAMSGDAETTRRRIDRLLAATALSSETGDIAGALGTAQQAREIAARAGQRESEWRALTLIARASGDRTAANESAAALNRLWEALGSHASSVSRRPDIRRTLNALGVKAIP